MTFKKRSIFYLVLYPYLSSPALNPFICDNSSCLAIVEHTKKKHIALAGQTHSTHSSQTSQQRTALKHKTDDRNYETTLSPFHQATKGRQGWPVAQLGSLYGFGGWKWVDCQQQTTGPQNRTAYPNRKYQTANPNGLAASNSTPTPHTHINTNK